MHDNTIYTNVLLLESGDVCKKDMCEILRTYSFHLKALMKSFPKKINVMMDICVEKNKQFFRALYKATQDENSKRY